MVNLGFWGKINKSSGNNQNKPILCLAPMADVTDRAFRRIIAKYSGNTELLNTFEKLFNNSYVTWTEFVSADGLFLGGYDALINDLAFTEEERPIVAQFFTSKPEMMEKAARLALELGFDGIDINMGCPDRSVEKQNAGAALIKNPSLAKEIILAAKRGAGDLPVSVKTRIGYNKNEIETWLPNLLETEPALITVHTRTRKEMSLVPARWENIKRAVEIRDEVSKFNLGTEKTLIIGNGDVLNIEDAEIKVKESGCDGAMIGRAIFGNPWFFSGHVPTVQEKLEVLIEHTKLFDKLVLPKPSDGGQGKSFAVMKKHFKAYVNGFIGAKDLRIKLMETENSKEVEIVIKDFLRNI